MARLLVVVALASAATARADARRVAEIVAEMPRLGTARALADAYAAVEGESGEDAQRLWVFIGDVERRHDRRDQAAAAYARARALGEDTSWGKYARLGAGDLKLAARDFAEAEALFTALAGDPDRAIANVAIQERKIAHAQRRYAWVGWGALGAIAATLAFNLVVIARRRELRASSKVPAEIVFAAPVLAGLTLASALAERRLVVGFAALSAGWLALAWLGLLSIAADRRRRWLIGALWLLASVAALYVFAWRSDLIFAIRETLKTGVDH